MLQPRIMIAIDRLRKITVYRLPLTRIKLFIARILYALLHTILRTDHRQIQRHGVCYAVDLSEGIDLSLFLFGNFQSHVTHNKFYALADDAVIFDIGANVGSMAFKFAQLVPHGHVFAFEPTGYALAKLKRNLSLNPDLAKRITPVQVFVFNRSGKDHQITAYSSWKIDGTSTNRHRLHGGVIKSAESVPAITLDNFCLDKQIKKVDLIKIDTDGHEFHVLRGARETLDRHRPYLIFEIGLYLLNEHEISFEEYYGLLSSLGYRLYTSKTGREITRDNFELQIPLRYAIDIVAIPQ